MKKFFALLFVFLILLASVNCFAAPINYLAGYTFEAYGLSCSVTVDGLSAAASGITQSFSSPLLDILPAVKMALGRSESATVTLSGTFSVIMASDEATTNAHVLIRGGINIKNSEQWDDIYTQTLKGDAPLFHRGGGNVLLGLKRINGLSNTKSHKFSISIDVTRNQVYSYATPNWFLCIDGLNAAAEGKILAIGFKDVSLTLGGGGSTEIKITPPPEKTATPKPTATPTPPPTVTPYITAEPTLRPTRKPTPTPTSAPTENPKMAENFFKQPLSKDLSGMAGTVMNATLVMILIVAPISLIVTFIVKRINKK